MSKPISEYPVMKACCATCPFKLDDKGRLQDVVLANAVTTRTLFKGQQICHGTEGPNREVRNRCKGSYEHNMEIYRRLNMDLTLIK